MKRELKRRYWREYSLLDMTKGAAERDGPGPGQDEGTGHAAGEKNGAAGGLQRLPDAALSELDLDQAWHFTDGSCLLPKVDTSGNV